ncbi:LysE family translocator [Thalassobius sp. Cn5-15]|uniref:LysE family translocator n=1 Tax=Thalassobius sp. Cn5-15 TaxID=2917763 RepID=UPI001EF2C188|nr:LysE family translocator [Thalassobius sp. Cn5-15]MCG7494276.1 LysE family translocator [Thalassobius sp. Cn5-15]
MTQTTIALVLFLFPLAYSPGPGNLVFAANGAKFGFRATMPANLGYHVATWCVTAAIGLGFIATLNESPIFFKALQAIGACYIFWIASKILRASTFTTADAVKPLRFQDGAVLLLLNPKGYVIMALMFTQFLETDQTDDVFAVLLITTIFTANNAIAFIVWTLIGDRIAQLFHAPQHKQIINTVFAILLGAVAIWMVLI